MKKEKTKKNKGFTLIELMVAVTVFSIITVMIMSIYINMSKAYVASLAARTAQQSLRSSMDLISRYGKQAKSADWDAAGKALSLRVENEQSDGTLLTHVITFTWQPEDASPTAHKVIKMKVETESGTTVVPVSRVTSSNLEITNFSVTPSAGIPAVINLSLSGHLLDDTLSLEKGAGGNNEIKIDTTITLKG